MSKNKHRTGFLCEFEEADHRLTVRQPTVVSLLELPLHALDILYGPP